MSNAIPASVQRLAQADSDVYAWLARQAAAYETPEYACLKAELSRAEAHTARWRRRGARWFEAYATLAQACHAAGAPAGLDAQGLATWIRQQSAWAISHTG